MLFLIIRDIFFLNWGLLPIKTIFLAWLFKKIDDSLKFKLWGERFYKIKKYENSCSLACLLLEIFFTWLHWISFGLHVGNVFLSRIQEKTVN